MMLPGAVSLGAYEGGALAAVLKAVQASKGRLVIDAMASASAGSMTALIASRALLCGADPIDLMVRTWVKLPQLSHLETKSPTSPLTMDDLKATADGLLGNDTVKGTPNRQREPIRLSMALTALGGLTYKMTRLVDPNDPKTDPTLLASTYVDWYAATLDPVADGDDAAGSKQFRDLLEASMASGSTPVGFPPLQLDRQADQANYLKNGIVDPGNMPFKFWYSDGGDLDNQPLGRLLDLIAETPNPEDDRVIVLLQIEPAAAITWTGTWFGDQQPSWLSTLLHVDHLRSNQSLYDDLRRLQKTNQHLDWIEQVAADLERVLEQEGGADALQRAVETATTTVTGKRQAIRDSIGRAPSVRAGADPAQGQAPTLASVLAEAAGLQGKKQVRVEIISPLDDPKVHLTADQQLSGEFLFHFGGFFDQEFRESDFALGYRNAMTWLDWWLEGRVDDPDGIRATVKAAYEGLGFKAVREGGASVRTLPLREKLEGLGLVAHIAHVVEHDLLFDHKDAAPADTGAPADAGAPKGDGISHAVSEVESGVHGVVHGVADHLEDVFRRHDRPPGR